MGLRFFLLSFLCINILTSVQAAEQKPSVSVEAFGQLPSFGQVELSPDGKRVASLQNFKGTIFLVTQ
ncbi:hypothetical protein MNBD_ALPHA02-183, partial [hydrothermal vent metagenome]